MEKSEFILLRSFDTLGEAMIYKSLLESAGIECFLKGEVMASVLPIQNDNMPIRLVVHERDRKKAEDFLAAKIEKPEPAPKRTASGQKKTKSPASSETPAPTQKSAANRRTASGSATRKSKTTEEKRPAARPKRKKID